MTLFSTLIGMAVTALAPAQGDSTPVVVINGDAITAADYYHRMEHLNSVYASYGEKLVEVSPGLITLDRMITEKLTLQLAAAHGVSPRPTEIDAAYASRLKATPTLEKDAAEQGVTVADLKSQVAVDLARYKLLTEGVIVTDQEVQTDYDNHREYYMTPRLIDVRYIVVESKEEQDAVDADLAAGQDFAKVASARSLDVSKVTGGLLQNRPMDQLDKPIQDALKAIKIGQTTPWIPVPSQPSLSEKILYVRATEPVAIPYDPELKESIRRRMMVERGTAKNNLTQEMKDMLAKAKIDIKDPAFAKAYGDMRSKLLAAPKPVN